MLDVHAPHEPMHGWRDFLLHIFTITIGLLIALSLEGLVEWHEHRRLARDAESSLHREIASNADGMADTLTALHKAQADLNRDGAMLQEAINTGKFPKHGRLIIGFNIRTFDGVSWKTAQSTGALAFMPYDLAQEYSDIYVDQDDLASGEQQAARDTIVALGPFLNSKDGDPDPNTAQAAVMIEKIEVLQGQLLLVDSFMQSLDRHYKSFLAKHPG